MSSSVFRLLVEAAQNCPDAVALLYPVNGEYREMQWKELYGRVGSVSNSLLALRVGASDRVAILSKTRLEWSLVDLGVMGIAACTVPLYHSSSDEDILFILKDCEASVIFVENMDLFLRVKKLRLDLPCLKYVIVIDANQDLSKDASELSFAEFLALSGSEDTKAIKERIEGVQPNDLASIVYTSGTTGNPKGAMITHDNFLYEAHAIEKLGLISGSDVQLLFLPLAHIFARILQIAWLKTRHVLAFAEDTDRLSDNILATRPTLLAGVPRVFEKIHAQIVQQGLSSPGFKKRLVKWAFEQADAKRKSEMDGDKSSSLSWMLSESLVFSKIKTRLDEKFGGRLRLLISGGAALSPDVGYFFKFAGLTVLEGWGLTETTAASCLNVPASNRIGTVGRPVPGTEVKIADDGEVLVKGRGVFLGYWKNTAATTEAFDENGFFKTGDIGAIQPGGYLKITDRKKEIIVSSVGKKVAPQKLEGMYKSACPLIGQSLVFGDAKPYLVGIFALDFGAVQAFAKTRSLKGDLATLSKEALVHAEIERAVSEVNKHLASFEQVKKFAILDHEFAVGEQLTPTLKVKRKYCSTRYATIFAALYDQARAA